MVKTCTGTKNFKGCGQVKMDSEFSISYGNMCRECANRYKRTRYQKNNYPHQEGTSLFMEYATKPWR